MALRMNKLVPNTNVSLRRSHARLADDAFALWPSLDVLERDPFVCFADDEGSDGDGDGEGTSPPAKTFTQADVDRIVQRRLKKETEAREALEAKLADVTKRLEERDADEDSGSKSPTKKLERELEKERARVAELTKALETTKASAETSVSRLKQSTLERQVMSALAGSGALPGAMKHALAAFLAEAKGEVEFDDEGAARFVVNVGGVPFEDDGSGAELSKAAAKWLAANKHFAKAPETGGGPDPKLKGPSVGPNGSLDIEKASVEDLLSAGLSKK